MGRSSEAGHWSEPARAEIATSWQRARSAGVDPERALDRIPFAEVDLQSRLLVAARPVLEVLEAELAGTSFCTVLADRDCRIVHRWFDDPRVERILDSLGVRTGATFLEEHVGTNALGTALETGHTVEIHGAEHFAAKLKQFSCFGQPIRNPVTSRVEGVIDLTALGDTLNPLLGALVAHAVSDIQQRLVDDTRAVERELLAAFQSASGRCAHAVVALSENVVLSNRAALDLLDSVDFAALRAFLGDGRGDTGFCTRLPLADGTEVVVRATPVGGTPEAQLFDIEPVETALPTVLPSAPIAEPHLPLLVSGAPGTGRTRAAVEAARHRPVMNLEPALALLEGPESWARAFSDAMATRIGTLIVEGVDLLPESLVSLVIGRARAQRRPELIVTSGPFDELTGLARTLASMCVRSADLKPLALRAPEIGTLAARILTEIRPGSQLRLTPSAVEALAGQRWVGNFHELRAVMSAVASRRSVGDVTVADLPPDYRTPDAPAALTTLQRAERDAVVSALERSGGNKVKAAQLLGVSRTTLYSMLRTLRISG